VNWHGFTAALVTVANPSTGDGLPQAFVFWICLVIVLATFILALNGKLSGDGAIFSTGTALVFGYWMRDQQSSIA
jgi:hypothetical protein